MSVRITSLIHLQAADQLYADTSSCHTFAHPPAVGAAVLVMMRVHLKHVLQALTDDITGVSGTATGTTRRSVESVKHTSGFISALTEAEGSRNVPQSLCQLGARPLFGPR